MREDNMLLARSTVLNALALAALAFCEPAAAQQQQSRMIIATHVACRSAPDLSSAVAVQYHLGDVFLPRGQSESDSGTWYLDTSRVPGAPSPGCWIHGSLTTEWSDREAALLAAADRILGRTDQVPFDDFVAVDNLLRQTPSGAHAPSTVLETSPLLQLRRLQVLERAARAPGTWRMEVRRSPLKAAWFFANGDVLRYHEPAGRWIVPADAYWQLHDRYRSTPVAEEIAWAAAGAAVPGDECDAVCVLSRLNQTYARYWAAYPGGRWLSEAFAEAQRQLEHALQAGCFGGSGEALNQTNAFRATLREATSRSRETLLGLVREIEGRCGVER
jgi:hypothetical protein